MRKSIVFILVILMLPAYCGCAKKQPLAQPVSETRLMLDTVCTVTVYDPPDQSIVTGALDLCEKYNETLSISWEGGDLWNINHAGGAPVTVDQQTADVIKEGLDYGDFSGGMFDITIGKVSTLWDFTGNPAVPSAPDLAAALETVDYRKVTVTGDTVRLSNPKTWLDLGGIAKGYIADQLAAYLKGRGVNAAIIDLGGNIYTVGAKPDGSPWRVGIKQPFEGGSEIIGALSTGEASIVTSGIYERQFVQDGVMYHHILDPATGMPVKSDLISATIVTSNSSIGDALSTIVILAGSANAKTLLDKAPGVIGAVLMRDDGQLIQYGNIDFTAAK